MHQHRQKSSAESGVLVRGDSAAAIALLCGNTESTDCFRETVSLILTVLLVQKLVEALCEIELKEVYQ